MKKILLCLTILSFLYSCDKAYKVISDKDFKKFTVQDTLTNKSNLLVMKIGETIDDEYSRLLVKSNRLYLFESGCELENDSIILSYYPAFIIDEDGEFRKNGIWVYSQFYTEGKFPFHTKGIKFSPDSIPKNWNKKLPTQEGIYFYENNTLKMISKEQSEEKFREKEKDGFYFFPNKGRLFDRINITELD
ncbi:hypothetical protein [Flavobacterium sp. U410]|jgi:hypothetical protein